MTIGWTIFVAIVIAIIVGLASRQAGASVIEMIILIFLADMLLGIFNLDKLLRPRPAERIEHIAPEPKILKRAREMRARANRSLHCSWCSMEYDDALKTYLDEFRGLKPVVHRLINIKRRPSDISAHLGRFIAEIRAEKYVVTSTHHEAFEFLIADKNELLLLVPYATQYGISEGFYSTDVDFANAISRMYEHLALDGNQLVIPAEADDNEAKRIVAEWIEKGMK